jgi:hypothetical protein
LWSSIFPEIYRAAIQREVKIEVSSVHPETIDVGVILRSEATKNLVDMGLAEILRGVLLSPPKGSE